MISTIRKLFDVSWGPPTEDQDLEQVRQWLSGRADILPGWKTPPDEEEAVMKLMVHPVLRGIYGAYNARCPYSFDASLRERAERLGREGIRIIQDWADTRITTESWMTFISYDLEDSTTLIKYLVPTFVLTTRRSTMVVDFSDLIQLAYSSAMHEDAAYSLRKIESARLLIVEDVDARHGLYKRVAGQLGALFKRRGRKLRSTVFILPAIGHLQKQIATASMSYQGVAKMLADVGVGSSDPMNRYLLGWEAHTVYHGYNEASNRKEIIKVRPD